MNSNNGHTGGMNMTAQPANGTMMMHHRHMMMHMTFFWGKNAEILFSGWPGYNHLGLYILSLVMVFFFALLVEWLSHCKYIKESTHHVAAGLIQTAMYALRIGLGYMVMLAVMSFNAGVFLVAILGHTLGFLFFGSRAFHKSPEGSWKTFDLPPSSC